MFGKFVTIILVCVTIILICHSNTATARIEDGLVSVWTLDKDSIKGNSVNDTFGKNHGAFVGNPKEIKGKLGEALSFDGVVDYVHFVHRRLRLTVKMTLDIEPESATMEALIKPVLDSRNPIYDKYNYGIQLLQSGNSDTVGIWIRDDKVAWPSAYTEYPKDDEWHFVTGVVKHKEHVQIYLDGKLKKTTPAPNPIDKAYSSLLPMIAYTQHLGGIWYHGSIDEVAVYERALSEIEVQKNYADRLAVSPAGKLTAIWGRIKKGL
ncbi:LamG domain-containing protein [bacterium]|nr:LamG domain-containing protein [bacterium]